MGNTHKKAVKVSTPAESASSTEQVESPHQDVIAAQSEGAEDSADFTDAAQEIHRLDEEIRSSDKATMKLALQMGGLLVRGKLDLKKQNTKRSFQNWVETDCKIPYKRAYNYMRLFLAAEKPSLKKLGLTEAYVTLKLVKRASKDPATPSAATTPPVNPEKSDIAIESPAAKTTASSPPVNRRKIATYELVKHVDVYTLEVDELSTQDLEFLMLRLADDIDGLLAVINDGGLLIKTAGASN